MFWPKRNQKGQLISKRAGDPTAADCTSNLSFLWEVSHLDASGVNFCSFVVFLQDAAVGPQVAYARVSHHVERLCLISKLQDPFFSPPFLNKP